MHKYEILYIVSSAYTDTEVTAIQEKVSGLIEDQGGTIIRNEQLGKLKLAYPIKKQRHGTYVLVYFDASADAMKKLDQLLKLTEEVLRHTIVLRKAGAEKQVFELESYEPPLSPEGHKKRVVKKPTAPVARVATQAKAGEKMSMEELDKKLDEILESTPKNL